MPASESKLAAGTAGLVAFGYVLGALGDATLGVLYGSLTYLAAWLVASGWIRRTLGDRRGAVTGALATLVLVRSTLVEHDPLLGLLAAGVVVGVAVATSPRGPLAG